MAQSTFKHLDALTTAALYELYNKKLGQIKQINRYKLMLNHDLENEEKELSEINAEILNRAREH